MQIFWRSSRTGCLGMLISMLQIAALNQVKPISVYSLNLITGLALGLAIDYSLLIVTRYRAVVRTAGVISAATETPDKVSA